MSNFTKIQDPYKLVVESSQFKLITFLMTFSVMYIICKGPKLFA